MKNRSLAFLLAFFILGFAQRVTANHLVGAEISYRSLDSFRYEVITKLYRDCSKGTIGGSIIYLRVGCDTSSNFEELDKTLVSIRKITDPCDTLSCKPTNTTGSRIGFEEFTYRSVVDLTASKFQSLQNCCVLRFEIKACCFSNSVLNGGANQYLYSYAAHNRCARITNELPNRLDELVTRTCLNQPLYGSVHHRDGTERDSIQYSSVQPIYEYGNPMAYASGYSLNVPIHLYDPTGKGWVNPNAYPPIGFYFDGKSGSVTTTPTLSGEYVLAVQVTEWTHDANGSPVWLSTKHYNTFLRVEACPGNNPPTMAGYTGHAVCVGDTICFDITTDDKIKIPPPPMPNPPPDSTKITWDQGIQGATFEVLSDTALHQTGRFCWVPDSAHFGLNYFQVKVQDNACPIPSTIQKTFTINVQPRVDAAIKYTDLGCGQMEVDAQLLKSYGSSVRYLWSILDTNHLPFSPPYQPQMTGRYEYLSKDTVTSRFIGKQILKLTTTAAGYCLREYIDTLVVTDAVSIAVPNDTVICCGDLPLDLRPLEVSGAQGGRWQSGHDVDSNGQLKPGVQCTRDHRTFNIQYSIQEGNCTASDSFEVDVMANPHSGLSSISLCPDSSLVTTSHLGISDSFDWTYFNFQWSSPDLSAMEWDSFYTPFANIPQFKLIKKLLPTNQNPYASVQLNLTTSAGPCAARDSGVITFLYPRTIDRSLFDSSGNEYALCRGDAGLILQKDAYPASWMLDADTLHSPYLLDASNLTNGNHRLRLRAGKNCPADTLDFNVLDRVQRTYLIDSLVLEPEDDRVVKLINLQPESDSFRWTIDPSFSILSTSHDAVEFRTPVNYTIPSNTPFGMVTIENRNAGVCTTRWDTTQIHLIPTACTDFTYTPPLILEAAYHDFQLYEWEVNDQPITSTTAPWRSELLTPLVKGDTITLTTTNFENRKCVVTKTFDQVSILPVPDGWMIYPNPVKEQLHIIGIPHAELSIYSVQGMLVMRSLDSTKVDCRALPPGFYMLILENGLERYQHAFIKE